MTRLSRLLDWIGFYLLCRGRYRCGEAAVRAAQRVGRPRDGGLHRTERPAATPPAAADAGGREGV